VSFKNPVLDLPACGRLRSLAPDDRAAIAAILRDIQRDARARAETCWRRHKGPMATYWRAVGVYAGHIARALR